MNDRNSLHLRIVPCRAARAIGKHAGRNVARPLQRDHAPRAERTARDEDDEEEEEEEG